MGSGHIEIILIIISVSLITIPVFAESNVVIYEVEPSPADEEKGWVKLYNPSENPVSLSGWEIATTKDLKKYSLSGSIEACGFKKISLRSLFTADFEISYFGPVILYDNNGELVQLTPDTKYGWVNPDVSWDCTPPPPVKQEPVYEEPIVQEPVGMELYQNKAFEPELYDGFFIEYGKCEVVVEADVEYLEIMTNKYLKESLKGSFCNLIQQAKFEYDYTDEEGVWTNKITHSGSEPVIFITRGDDEALNIVLPQHWEKGDSLISHFAIITEVEYNGIKEIKINDKNLQVYEFVGEGFAEVVGGVGQLEQILQYEVSSGFLVSVHYKIKFASLLAGAATAELLLNAVEISEPSIISQITSATEGKGGCLIATATYGSELALQVQQLRELRDYTLLQTQSGSAFMSGFNEFYYSFSPSIADYERENPIFKEAVKLTITPLLTSLSILNYVNMDSEVETLVYGIGIISLNVGMYFVMPVMLIQKLRNKI